MEIKILFEDENILALDKPAGLMVHPDGKKEEFTITSWLLEKYPNLKEVGEPIIFKEKEIARPGIIHRLDKETSGVLLIVKNSSAFNCLKKQFLNREIKKIYWAIVQGWPKNDYGIINKPIGRSPVDFRRRLAGRGARGELKEAITEWKVLKRFKAKTLQADLSFFSLIEVKPKTGRTHQIRVHLKYLNYPIVGDLLYNPKGLLPIGLNRMALHAKSIEFADLSGKRIKIESEIPLELIKIIS